jgi:RNA polymerase I-specific transcription-initiation factor
LDSENGIEDTTSTGGPSRTKYISEAIQKIAVNLTASRHIIGTLTEIPSELQGEPEESAIPTNLHFPHLFKAEELLARSQLKLNPAATALASDWDLESDPNTYSFRRLDGMTAEEVLQNEQTTTKKKRRRPSTHFAVQDAAPVVPEVVDTHTKSFAAKKEPSSSLPSMHDLEFSTQIFPPSPETKKTATAISASQPVAGPFGSRFKHVKKKKKRKEGF